ncbi:MAG TPA: serpin family protein [Mycobacteriales bacterium]|nr:serpin family protein [Mycobacteriales bacterium]
MRGVALALHRLLVSLAGAGNLVWSPYSVAAALGLAGMGAAGPTRAEFEELLGELTELASVLRAATFPTGPALPELAVANALWLPPELAPRPEYLAGLLSWPGGAVHTGDFRRDPDGVRLAINAQVEKVTHGLVRELLGAGDVDAGTRAVLVNALWLKVAWAEVFAASATRPVPFHAPAGMRLVPTMHATRSLPYAAAGGWRAVTLATTGAATDGVAGGVVVDLLLPDGDLTTAERVLTPELLADLGAGRTAYVDLAVPRFRVTARAALQTLLPALGLVRAFTDDADFSGLLGGEPPDAGLLRAGSRTAGPRTAGPLKLDRVVHQAVLTVDEHGLEGAAATAVTMRLAAAVQRPAPLPFHVDRPFLVLVRHVPTGAIYFLARVTEP